MNISPNIHVFIISWQGHHENAAFIANQLLDIQDQVSIIFSDPDPLMSFDAKCRLIHRPNELFFGDKFKACLDNSIGDHLLIIHADCKTINWLNLVYSYHKAINQITNLGVWSPEVNYTFFGKEITSLYRFQNNDYEIVCYIDAIIFGISKSIQNRMKLADFRSNKFGWSIDRMIASHALSTNKLLVLDKSVQVQHSKSRGYDQIEAEKQGILFLRQLSMSEKIYDKLLQSYMTLNIIKKEKKKNFKA